MKYLINIIIALVIFIIVLERFSLNKEQLIDEKNYYLERILKVARHNRMIVINIDHIFYIVDLDTNRFMRVALIPKIDNPDILTIRFIDLRDKNLNKTFSKGLGNKWKNYLYMKEVNIPQLKTIGVSKDMDNNKIIKKVKNKLSLPYVIKLSRGMKGEDVYLNLKKTSEIKDVLDKIKSKAEDQTILIQEQSNLKNEYRIIIFGSKIISIFEKQRPYVIGDSESNIKELVKNINKKYKKLERKFNVKLPVLIIDPSISLNEKGVPDNGKKVFLSDKKNSYYGSLPINIDIGTIHPDNNELFLKIAKLFDIKYNQNLLGIDFMMDDITKSYKNNLAVVLEVNAMPGFKYVLSSHPKSMLNITEKMMKEEEINADIRILKIIKHIQKLDKPKIVLKHRNIFRKKLKASKKRKLILRF